MPLVAFPLPTGVWGDARLGNIFGIIRCSEIASEAILEQKQSRSSYMTRGVLHPNLAAIYMQLLSQLTWIVDGSMRLNINADKLYCDYTGQLEWL